MPPRTSIVAIAVTVLGCTRVLGYETTELVRVPTSVSSPAASARTPTALIICPIAGLHAYAENPKPLTPHQRSWATRDPEGWSRIWIDYADQANHGLAQFGTFQPKRPDDFKNYLHAGLCAVTDLRSGQPQETVRVVIHDNPERRGGGGSRRFQFSDGHTFLSVIDWLP